MTTADEVFAIFSSKGESSYFGEPVSQLEHALQTAHFARRENAPDHLVVAALVHDIGHLVADTEENIADFGVDAKHEEIGQSWLSRRFGPDVCEPVYLHVSAKRYLCATDRLYLSVLSPASLKSLQLQGGPMSAEEVAAFERNQYCSDAVRLRKWDDAAKIPDVETAALQTYRDLIEKAAHLGAE